MTKPKTQWLTRREHLLARDKHCLKCSEIYKTIPKGSTVLAIGTPRLDGFYWACRNCGSQIFISFVGRLAQESELRSHNSE